MALLRRLAEERGLILLTDSDRLSEEAEGSGPSPSRASSGPISWTRSFFRR